MFQARLSPDPQRSVVMSDQLGNLSQLFLTPHRGNALELFDGVTWVPKRIEEGFPVGVQFVGLPDGNHDVFAYLEGDIVRLEASPWPGLRALQPKDGRLLKAGDGTRLFVGSVRIEGGGVTHDSKRRHIWNYFNQTPHRLQHQINNMPTEIHANLWRMAGNSSESYVSVMLGDESLIALTAKNWVNRYPYPQVGYTGIGVNASVPHSDSFRVRGHTAGADCDMTCLLSFAPPAGHYRFNLLERVEVPASSTTGNQPAITTCGLTGWVWC